MSFVRHKSSTHRERFIHIRDGSTIIPSTRYRGATLFFREEGGLWFYSVALCSQTDTFQKRVGRNVARRRYFADIQAGFEPLNLIEAVGGKAGAEPTYANAEAIYTQVVESLEGVQRDGGKETAS